MAGLTPETTGLVQLTILCAEPKIVRLPFLKQGF
jgi:hypothetical protein